MVKRPKVTIPFKKTGIFLGILTFEGEEEQKETVVGRGAYGLFHVSPDYFEGFWIIIEEKVFEL
ncbi:hypothetical protein [Phocaeicola faecicola]|uniref:hypothetical protein n=1 Tax=Phocaeicola faecicola TaxID=2739389 RepID=UPI0015B45663|nr:hypothetical protein [Phocaeicola faecicola]MCI5743678.1 hypothetical protein [Bacteroides sp.]MDD6907694.1 hypothetical protein [Bacteroidaceae bacterium]MDY4872761.1 hypothetical protein [Phocaeicola faecicola]